MSKKTIVHLRVYKGTQMTFDANQKPLNENQLVKMSYNSFEWDNFMKMAGRNGYCKMEVEEVIEVSGIGKDEKTEPVEDITAIKAAVKNAINPEQEVVLTPEQKEIKELKAKLEAFMNSGAKPESNLYVDNMPKIDKVEDVKDIKVEDSKEVKSDYPTDPAELRAMYEEVTGDKPHHKAKDETLIEKMNEFKAK